MKEICIMTAHGRKRVCERLGIPHVVGHEEISLLEFQYGDRFRFIWDNTIKKGVIYRKLKTVVPKNEPFKPTYNKEVRYAL